MIRERVLPASLRKELERDYIASLLHGLPFLRNVSEAERHAFIERATLEPRHYNKGQVVVKEGVESACLHIIKSGTCEITRRKRDELARLSRGINLLASGFRLRLAASGYSWLLLMAHAR